MAALLAPALAVAGLGLVGANSLIDDEPKMSISSAEWKKRREDPIDHFAADLLRTAKLRTWGSAIETLEKKLRATERYDALSLQKALRRALILLRNDAKPAAKAQLQAVLDLDDDSFSSFFKNLPSREMEFSSKAAVLPESAKISGDPITRSLLKKFSLSKAYQGQGASGYDYEAKAPPPGTPADEPKQEEEKKPVEEEGGWLSSLGSALNSASDYVRRENERVAKLKSPPEKDEGAGPENFQPIADNTVPTADPIPAPPVPTPTLTETNVVSTEKPQIPKGNGESKFVRFIQPEGYKNGVVISFPQAKEMVLKMQDEKDRAPLQQVWDHMPQEEQERAVFDAYRKFRPDLKEQTTAKFKSGVDIQPPQPGHLVGTYENNEGVPPIVAPALPEMILDPNQQPQIDLSRVTAGAAWELALSGGRAAASMAAFSLLGYNPAAGVLFNSVFSNLPGALEFLDQSRGYSEQVGARIAQRAIGGLEATTIAPSAHATQILNPLQTQTDGDRVSVQVGDVFSRGVRAGNTVDQSRRAFQNWFRDANSPFAVY